MKAAITLLSEEMEELDVGEPIVIEYVSNMVMLPHCQINASSVYYIPIKAGLLHVGFLISVKYTISSSRSSQRIHVVFAQGFNDNPMAFSHSSP